ncbi:MAG: hypothetical protein JWN78_2601 [Bacteroidota bacterium]|nr:hypothetical protein [Bacteroidota bacterium]
MSENKIKCPNCGNEFPIDEVLNHQAEEKFKKEFEEKLRNSNLEILKQKESFALQQKEFEEKKKNENELFQKRLEQKLEEEKIKITQEQEEKLKEEYESNYKKLQEENIQRKEQNQTLKNEKLTLLKKEEQLEEDKKNFELKMQEEKKALKEELEGKLKKQFYEENELKAKEKDLQIESMKKVIDELKRKSEQGSMQLQGEAQEIALEALLKEAFPFDLIEEVGKGSKGADCIQTVRNNFGQVCGKIIYESKRTQAFSNEWVEKLKIDMRAQNADIGIIVTQKMPKEMEQFGDRNGIWICSYNEVRAVSHVLRCTVLKVFAVAKSQENKGDKMNLMYDYLTSNEFNEQWKAIREGFLSMKHSIDNERSAMEKLWKSREKQLEKILLNASHISGSVEGIAGTDSIDIRLIEE